MAVIVAVIVIVIVIGPLIVAVHVHRNATVGVIEKGSSPCDHVQGSVLVHVHGYDQGSDHGHDHGHDHDDVFFLPYGPHLYVPLASYAHFSPVWQPAELVVEPPTLQQRWPLLPQAEQVKVPVVPWTHIVPEPVQNRSDR
jgi:hypothetical protein